MAYVAYGSLSGLVPDQGIGREDVTAAQGVLFVLLATWIQLFPQTEMEVERHKNQLKFSKSGMNIMGLFLKRVLME